MPVHLVNEELNKYTEMKIDEKLKRLSDTAEVSLAAIKIRTGM